MKCAALCLAALCASAALAAEAPPYPTNECLEVLSEQPRLEPLRGKMHFGPGEADIAILALNDKPTEAERQLILNWARARDYCFSIGAAYRQQYAHPVERTIAERAHAAARKLRASLAAGDISYGEYAQRAADNYLRAQHEWDAEYAKISAEHERAANQAAQDYLQWQASQPTTAELVLDGFRRSRGTRTICRPSGLGGVTCATR